MTSEEATKQARVKHRPRPLKSLFLLDVLSDRDSRPTFIWAAVLLFSGTMIYHWLEGWSFLDSLYYCVITLTTIGYGDFTPTTPLARLFTIFFVINGIVMLLSLFDRIRSVRGREVERLRREVEEEVQTLTGEAHKNV